MPYPAQAVQDTLRARIDALGPWFHNLHLLDGTETAPEHELGDFPTVKWREIAPSLPRLRGWSALDIGCNAGFYSFELARRGARVTAIDTNPRHLEQAHWAARHFGLEEAIEFRQMQVYDLARIAERFDLVWFTIGLHHLRYPLLALDIVRCRVRRLMMMQTLTFGGEEVLSAPEDLSLDQRGLMRDAGWPKMAFTERCVETDSTTWWVPNHACAEALLRSSGFRIAGRPAHETYLCIPADDDLPGSNASRQAELAAVLAEVPPSDPCRGKG